jgi:hypothetical protein
MEAVGVLAGGVAHDFNNLLTAILGYCHLGLHRMAADHPARACSEEILKAAERAAGLTKQLLAYSRKQVLAPQLLNLNDVVNGMETLLRRLIGEDVTLEVHLAEQPGSVKADPSQLDQVLMNLVVNAREAMPAGGRLTITTESVRVEESPLRDRAGLAVSGPWCCASPTRASECRETISCIRAAFTTSAGRQGHRLGLPWPTAYGAERRAPEVQSVVGAGSTFSVYLPCADAAAQRSRPLALVGDQAGLADLPPCCWWKTDQLRRLEAQALEQQGHQPHCRPWRGGPGDLPHVPERSISRDRHGHAGDEWPRAVRRGAPPAGYSGPLHLRPCPGSVVQKRAPEPGLAFLPKPFQLTSWRTRAEILGPELSPGWPLAQGGDLSQPVRVPPTASALRSVAPAHPEGATMDAEVAKIELQDWLAPQRLGSGGAGRASIAAMSA